MIFSGAAFIKPDIEFEREFSLKNSAPSFRKKFTLHDTDNAKLYVCGLGFAYYWINGKKVTEDLFTAPVSNYHKTLWYNTYDVSHLLKKGENTIAVICGNGWYNETIETGWRYHSAPWRDLPKFILKLEVNSETALVSDDTWKCQPRSATYFNQLRLGEYFDANLYDENWTESDFDDSGWEMASRDTTPPAGKFRECTCEPIRECRIYKPRKVWQSGEKSFIFDLGQNISGYVRLTACGKKGDELTIRYSEVINEEKKLEYYGMDTYYCKKGESFQTDKFICSGKKMTWSPKFAYHGFRYIEISGTDDVASIDVEGVFVHQDVEARTEFECSDPYLTHLFSCGVMSSWSNMFYLLTDCPTREKLGWTNDAQSSTEQLMCNFKIEKLLKKWHQDIKDAMLSDGSLPGIVPSAGWGYHWGNGPVSDGILFEIPYRIYLHTGNSSLLTGSIEYFERYLKMLDMKRSSEGLVEFGLDDWAAPGNIHIVDVGFINAVLEYNFCNITALAVRLAGRSDWDKFSERAKRLKEFIMKKYIDKDGRCTIDEQCSVSMLIYYDIYDDLEPLKKQLASTVERTDFHLRCGMVGIRRLLHALNKCGLHEYAYKVMTAEGYPGYKVWYEGDMTTLWEKWDVNTGSDSKNHHMYSDFLSWIIKTLAGISINEEKCGELEFNLCPAFLEKIDYVKFSYNTESGNIKVNWERKDGEIILSVEKDKNVKLLYNGEELKEKNIIKIGGEEK